MRGGKKENKNYKQNNGQQPQIKKMQLCIQKETRRGKYKPQENEDIKLMICSNGIKMER